MKIGIDGRFINPIAAGLSRYTQELVKNLLKIDHINQYYLLLMPEDYKSFKGPAKNLKPIKVNSSHYSMAEQYRLPFELSKLHLDFIHFLNFNHPLFYTGDFIITIQDLTLFLYPTKNSNRVGDFFRQEIMKLITRDAAVRAEQIIVPSENTKKDVVGRFDVNPRKITVIPDAVASEFRVKPKSVVEIFKKEKGLSKPFIFYIGQWRVHKNLVKLVKAFEKARKSSGIDFQLVIGGKPDTRYPEITNAIHNSRYKKEIIIPGFISDKELVLWYNAAEAFVLPSLYEGFGLPPLEAMACGAPVISSETSSLPEVLGDAAMLFDPENVSEMAKNIELVMKDLDLRKTLRAKGLKQVQKFSFEKMAKETLRVYNKIN